MKAILQAVVLSCAVIAACGALCPDRAHAQSTAAPAVAAFCAPCHGLDGIGHDVEIPNLAGQHDVYLRKQLLAFKNGQRKHPEMKYIARDLTDQELDAVVLYYSKLRPH